MIFAKKRHQQDSNLHWIRPPQSLVPKMHMDYIRLNHSAIVAVSDIVTSHIPYFNKFTLYP